MEETSTPARRRGGRTRRTTQAEDAPVETPVAAAVPLPEPPTGPAEEVHVPTPRRARRGARPETVATESGPGPVADAAVEAPQEPPAPPADAEVFPNTETPTTGTPSRRGRRGSGSTRRAAAASAATDTAAEAQAPEAQPSEPESQVAGQEPLLPPSQTQIPGPGGRRGRGGRDRGLDRNRGFDPRDRRDGRDTRDARDVRRDAAPTPRRIDGPASTPAAPRRSEGGGGSVEQLIARQNVLFEEFAQQQNQTMRELQRGLRGTGSPSQGSGSMLALPKVAVFLDVPNLIYAAEQVGARVDFGKLLDLLTDGRQLVRATAYAPITDDPLTRFDAQRFVQPVINKGWKIVTKPWKRFADGSMKANFDIELAVDILTMSDRLDIVVLLSGDGDFRRVCELVESKGVRVEVVAFAASTAMELRSVADQYTDLGQILHLVGH